jgi:hypothetical protein
LKTELTLALELHARTSKAVVIFVMPGSIFLKTDPTKLMFALVALKVIAAVVFFNWATAFRALSI